MNNGWRELESDPGIFTLLLKAFGVTGVEVEEVYDIHHEIDGPVYGFIFLFNWAATGEEQAQSHGSRRRPRQPSTSEAVPPPSSSSSDNDDSKQIPIDMFFPLQIIPNSCATFALLSVLLNTPGIDIGDVLTHLKEFTYGYDPESKGYAIANLPQLKLIHNTFSGPCYPSGETIVRTSSSRTQWRSQAPIFHFSSYVPIGGRLWELDGLKRHPVDHGPVGEGDSWVSTFREVIAKRWEKEKGGELFNLLAVRQEKLSAVESRIESAELERSQLADQVKERLVCYPYKSIDGDEDGDDDCASTTSRFGVRVCRFLERHHPAEFPHLMACCVGAEANGPKSSSSPAETAVAHTTVTPLSKILGEEKSTSNGNRCDDDECTSQSDGLVLNDERAERQQNGQCSSEEQAIGGDDGASEQRRCACEPAAWIRTCVNDDTRLLCDRLLAINQKCIADVEAVKEETAKHRRYQIDTSRQTHDYQPFIETFLKRLHASGRLKRQCEADPDLRAVVMRHGPKRCVAAAATSTSKKRKGTIVDDVSASSKKRPSVTSETIATSDVE